MTTNHGADVAADFLRDARETMERARYALRAAEMETDDDAKACLLKRARRYAASAREFYAMAKASIEMFGLLLAHHYQREEGGVFQGFVSLAGERGAWLWRSSRRYPHRQSAQRAAWREMGRIQA